MASNYQAVSTLVPAGERSFLLIAHTLAGTKGQRTAWTRPLRLITRRYGHQCDLVRDGQRLVHEESCRVLT